MWNFQKLIWILSIIPLSLLQEISDNINIYNELQNHLLEGIWTLQDENPETDVHQIQGIVKFSNNSIIYKGFRKNDKQDEQFSGVIFLNNVKLFPMKQWRGFGNTHTKGQNSQTWQKCENEFIVSIQLDNNAKTKNDTKLIIILESNNQELPLCNLKLKFSTRQSNQENQLQLILLESFSLFFCIYQIAFKVIFAKFVLHKQMKLNQLSLITLFLKCRGLMFIAQFTLMYFDNFFKVYIILILFILYLILISMWAGSLTAFLERKFERIQYLQIFRRYQCVIIIFTLLITAVVFIIMFIFCFNSLLFQLSYAFVLLPQVIHNIRWNCKEIFNLIYIFGYLSSGLIFQIFLNSYSINTKSIELDYLYISLFYTIYFLSLLLLYLQYKFGSRCFLPKCILDKYYSACAICLDSIVTADMDGQLQLLPVILTQCKHKFHEKCLKQWLQQKKECPLCRSVLNEINLQIIN